MLSAPVHMACSTPGHGGGLITTHCLCAQPAPQRPLTRDLGPRAARGWAWARQGPSGGKGLPWFETKTRMPGPSSHQPTTVHEILSLLGIVFLLKPGVIKKKRKKKKTHASFIFRTSSSVCMTSKINFAWMGCSNPVRSPWWDMSIRCDWAGSKEQGQMQGRTALVPRQDRGPWGGPSVCWRLSTPTHAVCQRHAVGQEMGLWSFDQ